MSGYTRPEKITSAEQALRKSRKLPRVWSDESALTQLTLIYVAELLEQLIKQRRKIVKRKRFPILWNKFLSRGLRSGMTMGQIGVAWQEQKRRKRAA